MDRVPFYLDLWRQRMITRHIPPTSWLLFVCIDRSSTKQINISKAINQSLAPTNGLSHPPSRKQTTSIWLDESETHIHPVVIEAGLESSTKSY